jgi:hypothetical protein
MSNTVPFTDADVARHRLVIDRRERAEIAAREANRRAEHPRDLAEWIGEGDEVASPPIIKRPAKHSAPLLHNRGLGVPLKEDEI